MRTGDRRKFADLALLEEVIHKWQSGQSLASLGREYDCDHSSIFWHIKKYGIKKDGEKIRLTNTPPKSHKKEKRTHTEKQREGHCPKCGMRLDGDYHKQYPC